MTDENIPAEESKSAQASTEQPSQGQSASKADEASKQDRQKVRKDSLEEFSDLVISRATAAHPTLKAVLAGTVEVFVKDRPFRAVFDFTASPPKRLDPGAKAADCCIETDERTLLRIHQGELNPQLAMVSDKMYVKGKAGLAVYFFNLLGN